MIINVAGISQGTTHLDGRLKPNAFRPDGDVTLAGPVRLDVTITKMGDDVYVDAHVEAALDLHCSRCLETFRYPLSGRIQELYIPDSAKAAQRSIDETCKLYYEATIDLAEDVQALIAVELPRKPLCRHDCPGLCPHCGKPLQEGPCPCTPPETGYHPFKDLKLE